MKIKLFGSLRQVAGNAEHEGSGTTIREVLTNLCADNKPLQVAIFEDSELRAHVRVMVNGRDSELAQGLETAVTTNDQIAVFPPIAGG